jgi:hypothetical protein
LESRSTGCFFYLVEKVGEEKYWMFFYLVEKVGEEKYWMRI